MDWGTALWDQHDAIEKHTQSGLELVERYVKFVKERVEAEQNHAKSLRAICKKYSRRGVKEDQETKFTNQQAFQDVVNELNDYAGQREQLADLMNINICGELTKYLSELKLERKTYLSDFKKAQQNLDIISKQHDISKKRFEKESKEAEKANQQSDKIEQDLTSTKADVDKAKVNAQIRTHIADESKNEYAAQLQKFNKEQNNFYFTETPTLFNKLQELDEKRIQKLAEGYGLFAQTERSVMPAINNCLDRISTTSKNTNPKQDSATLIEQHKTGHTPPGDVEFEDYSQSFKGAVMDNQHSVPKVRIKQLFNKKNKAPNQDRNMHPPPVEDLSQLAPEQRKKRLQEKIDEVKKELQKEVERSEGLIKMKGVYVQNSQLGDPAIVEPQINQTTQNISRLRAELARYESWLNDLGGGSTFNNNQISAQSPSELSPAQEDIYDCFDEEFEEDEPIAQCMALYDFEGTRDGEVRMKTGERLSLLVEDQGDGWVRVRNSGGKEGYVPASYIKTI